MRNGYLNQLNLKKIGKQNKPMIYLFNELCNKSTCFKSGQ